MLKATVRGAGATTRLILLDPQGRVVVVSDGTSASDPDLEIEEHLPAGDYTLLLSSAGGLGPFILDVMLTPSSSPSQPVGGPVGQDGYVSGTYSVATGDFNGDGIPDVATSEGVFLGLGDGTFQPTPVAVSLPEPAYAYALVVAGDFNGDGHLDLAYANSLGLELDVLLGNGDGTFRAAISYPIGNEVSALVVGDFNGDGHLDLALAEPYDEPDNPNGILVFLGNGDGTLAPPTRYEAGTSPHDLVAGDFNNDGRTDLAFDSPGSQVNSMAIWLLADRPTARWCSRARPCRRSVSLAPWPWAISTVMVSST